MLYLLLTLLYAVASAQSTIDVDVGEGGLVYNPSTVTAAQGSTINFHFHPGDHSVAQSNFGNPCVPSGPNAIWSGFINPSTSGVANTMFTVNINNTDPIWIYCAQVGHCASGMAMVINPPNSGETLDAYKKAAASVSNPTHPSTVQGGLVQPNREDVSGATNTPSTSTSTAATTTAGGSTSTGSGSGLYGSTSGALGNADQISIGGIAMAGALWAWAFA